MSEPLKLYVAVREDGFYKTGYNTASGTIVKDALMCSYLGARDRLCTPNEVEKGKVVEVLSVDVRASLVGLGSWKTSTWIEFQA